MVLRPADVLPAGHPLLDTLRDRVILDPGDPAAAMRDLRGKWGTALAVLPMRPPANHVRTQTHWLCVCECGTWFVVQADKLVDGFRLACTAACFKQSVERFAQEHRLLPTQARIALIGRTLSPYVTPVRSRVRVGKTELWKLPTGHRLPNPAGTGRRPGTTIPAMVTAVESAWAMTGVARECRISMHGVSTRQRVPSRDGFVVRWLWTARVTRVSDSNFCEGKPAGSIHAALTNLHTHLVADRSIR